MEMLAPSFTIEELTIEDMFWFVETAAVNMLTDELKRPELVNKAHLYNLACQGMDSKTAWVVKADGVCVGALGALVVPNLFDPSKTTLAEVFWYVLPEYRHTRAGAMLLIALDKAGTKMADDITLSLLPSSEVNFKSFSKRGYHLEEFAFRKKVK